MTDPEGFAVARMVLGRTDEFRRGAMVLIVKVTT
jgi:hypothetical protein